MYKALLYITPPSYDHGVWLLYIKYDSVSDFTRYAVRRYVVSRLFNTLWNHIRTAKIIKESSRLEGAG